MTTSNLKHKINKNQWKSFVDILNKPNLFDLWTMLRFCFRTIEKNIEWNIFCWIFSLRWRFRCRWTWIRFFWCTCFKHSWL